MEIYVDDDILATQGPGHIPSVMSRKPSMRGKYLSLLQKTTCAVRPLPEILTGSRYLKLTRSLRRTPLLFIQYP